MVEERGDTVVKEGGKVVDVGGSMVDLDERQRPTFFPSKSIRARKRRERACVKNDNAIPIINPSLYYFANQ